MRRAPGCVLGDLAGGGVGVGLRERLPEGRFFCVDLGGAGVFLGERPLLRDFAVIFEELLAFEVLLVAFLRVFGGSSGGSSISDHSYMSSQGVSTMKPPNGSSVSSLSSPGS